MNEDFTSIGRNISSLTRMMRMYYDRGLEAYRIGWGQQFFLQYIYEHPGRMPQELTERFHVDKGTTTKVLKKLCAEGYVAIEVDKRDHRVRIIQPLKKAEEAVKQIRMLHQQLHQILTDGMSEAECDAMVQSLEQLRIRLRNELLQGHISHTSGAERNCNE